jgi:energy-coupling factor transport system permease protein
VAGRASLTATAAADRGLPESIGLPGPTAFHRLNPLTKATLATVTAIAAVVVGGLIGPAVLVAVAVLLPAALAGVIGRLGRMSLLLALPIAVSALVINLFFFPDGETELLRIGPIVATLEGLLFGLEILARMLAISGAITLFYPTPTVRPGR